MSIGNKYAKTVNTLESIYHLELKMRISKNACLKQAFFDIPIYF